MTSDRVSPRFEPLGRAPPSLTLQVKWIRTTSQCWIGRGGEGGGLGWTNILSRERGNSCSSQKYHRKENVIRQT